MAGDGKVELYRGSRRGHALPSPMGHGHSVAGLDDLCAGDGGQLDFSFIPTNERVR